MSLRWFLLLAAASLAAASTASAQSLALRPSHPMAGSNADHLTVNTGEIVSIDLWLALDTLSVSGVDLHLSLPDGVTALDERADVMGLQPFSDGEIFPGAVIVSNGVNDLPAAAASGRVHLRYAALRPPGSVERWSGEGRLATIHLIVQEPLDHAELRLEHSPVLETRLVLPDGQTERAFTTLDGLSLSAVSPVTSLAQRSWAAVKQSAGE